MVVLPQNFSAPSPPSTAHAQLSPLVMRVALNDLESFPWSGSGSGSTFSAAAAQFNRDFPLAFYPDG